MINVQVMAQCPAAVTLMLCSSGNNELWRCCVLYYCISCQVSVPHINAQHTMNKSVFHSILLQVHSGSSLSVPTHPEGHLLYLCKRTEQSWGMIAADHSTAAVDSRNCLIPSSLFDWQVNGFKGLTDSETLYQSSQYSLLRLLKP